MRIHILWAFLLVGGTALAQEAPHLIPQPVSLTSLAGQFTLNKTTAVTYNAAETADVAALIGQQLGRLTALELPVRRVSGGSINTIVLVINSVADPRLGQEGYRLSTGPKGITITANQPAGLFYGAQTLAQLLAPVAAPGAVAEPRLSIPAMQVLDYPRFSWRGTMFDVSRHFFPKAVVLQFIDDIARLKINTFHWHLSDDQGWRIEIKSRPKLTSVGAWRVPRTGYFGERPDPKPGEAATYGGFYTQADIREVVQYALARHVTIVPEIDVPGHSLAAIAAYPNLSCTQDTTARVNPGTKFSEWYDNGTFKMLLDNSLNPADEAVYAFLDDVFGEVAGLFPGTYIHAGGDECYKGYWEKNPACQALMKAQNMTHVEELQGYFMNRVENIIQSKGKRMLGWDEILESGRLSPTATVMSWRGMKGGIEAAKKGHDVVMSPGNFAYLDLMQGDRTLEPRVYNSVLLKTSYSLEPVPDGVDSARILGAQANLWTEQIPTYFHAQYMLFPRLWALSEVFWSPKSQRNWAGFVPRMEAHMRRAEAAGVNYSRAAYDPVVATTLADGKLTLMIDTELPGLDVFYSLDDTVPGRYSPRYTQPLNVPEGNVTLRAITYRNGQPVGRPLTLTRDELQKRAK